VEEAEREALRLLEASPEDVDLKVVLANCYRKRALDLAASTAPSGLAGVAAAEAVSPAAELFSKSTRQLREALDLAPERRDIWLGLCQIEREAGNLDGLVSAVQGAAAAFPHNPGFAAALREQARPFIVGQDYDSAGAVLAPIAENNTTDIPSILAAGRALYLSGKREKGIEYLDRAIELRPSEAEVHHQRAEVAAFEGDFQRAAEHFRRAANLDRTRGIARLALVTSLHPLSRLEALRAARGAQNLWRNFSQLADDPVVILLMRQLVELLEKPTPSPYDLLRAAQQIARAELHVAALGEIEAVLTLDPGMAEAHFLRAETYGRIQQHEQVVASLNRALATIDRQPGRTFGVSRDEVLGALGTAQFQMGRYAEALETFSRVSRPADHAFEMALAYDRLGRREEAARRFREVIESGQDPMQVEEARSYLSSPSYQKRP
jgi:tetratricopeptide (TPR) repeat protein